MQIDIDRIFLVLPEKENLYETNCLAADFRIVHFATHGLLNSEHPGLSGIVLSLVNEEGQPVNGFLRLKEIYNLNFNADLVARRIAFKHDNPRSGRNSRL